MIKVGLLLLFLLLGGWSVHEWTDGDGSSGSSQMCSPH